jgi:hypothetical protein
MSEKANPVFCSSNDMIRCFRQWACTLIINTRASPHTRATALYLENAKRNLDLAPAKPTQDTNRIGMQEEEEATGDVVLPINKIVLDSATMSDQEAGENYETLMNAANCLSFGTGVGIEPEVVIKEVSVKEYVEHEYKQLQEELEHLKLTIPTTESSDSKPYSDSTNKRLDSSRTATAKARVEELNDEVNKLQAQAIAEQKDLLIAKFSHHEQKAREEHDNARLLHERKMREKLARRKLAKQQKQLSDVSIAALPPAPK